VSKEPRAKRFGKYIRSARQDLGASVRTAAARIGLSYGHLAKLERGEIAKPPTTYILSMMAGLYDKPLDEMMEEAGVRLELVEPSAVSGEEQFKRLMLSREFGPAEMKEEYLAHFPLLHRALIQELVSNVQRHTEARVRWQLLGDSDPGCPQPVSMNTYAEVIGAGTSREVAADDWKGAKG